MASKNKSWSRKAEDNKKKSQKELATMVQQMVQDGVHQELVTMSKKHKQLLLPILSKKRLTLWTLRNSIMMTSTVLLLRRTTASL